MRARLSILTVASLIATATLVAQTPSPAPPQATFRGGANVVRVDVYPTQDGRLVEDLTASDFEVFEDDVPQKIDGFERIQVRAPVSQESRIEPNTVEQSRAMAETTRGRVFVVFLDTKQVQFDGAARVATSIVRFLDRLIGEDDMVAIMTPEMSATDLAFGRKTDVLAGIINQPAAWAQRNRIVAVDPKDSLYESCYPGREALVEELKERRHEQQSLDALDGLVAHLTDLREERKAVLTISEGWALYGPNMSLANAGDGLPPPIPRVLGPRGLRRVGDPSGSTDSDGYAECEHDRVALSSMDNTRRLHAIEEGANRGNISFYPVDPRGLTDSDVLVPRRTIEEATQDRRRLRDRQSNLRELAVNTDGLAIVGTNNVDAALARILGDLSSYYLLNYASTNSKLDGKFRAIRVRVKRPGVQVRARRGYRGATTEEILRRTTSTPTSFSPSAAAMTTLAAIDARAPFRIRTSSWSRPAAGDAMAGTMWIVGELDFRTRRAVAWSAGAKADVTVVAGDGTNILSKTIDVPMAERSFAIRIPDGGQLGSGEYAVRVRMRPQNGGPDAVPLSDTARVQMSDRPSTLGEGVLWRRGPSTGTTYLMTADARFQRTERVRVELPTQASGVASARLLDRQGGPMAVPLQVSERVDSVADCRWIVVDVPLAPLAPGDYAIEVQLEGMTKATGFRLVP